MRVGVDVVADALDRAVAEGHLERAWVGTAEAAFGALAASGCVVLSRLERLLRCGRVWVPGDAVVVPFVAGVHRLVVAGGVAGAVFVGGAVVAVGGHPLLADEVSLRCAVCDLRELERAAIVHDAGLAELQVGVGGCVAGCAADVGRGPQRRVHGGVAVGAVEVVAGELAGVARVGSVVALGNADAGDTREPGLFFDAAVVGRSPRRRINFRGAPRRAVEHRDGGLVERGAGGLEAGVRGGEAFAERASVGFFGVVENVVDPRAGLIRSGAAVGVGGPIVSPAAGGQHLAGVGVVEAGERDLLQVVLALRATAGFASRLDCGEEQRDQHADDRDDDEEFDERESGGSVRVECAVGAPGHGSLRLGAIAGAMMATGIVGDFD